MRLDHDLEPLLPALLVQIHPDHDPEQIPNLVRNLRQQPSRVGHPDHHPTLVPPDVQPPTLGIRKPADPAKELVPPSLLPLDPLALPHTSRILPVSSSCIIPCFSARVFSRRASSAASSASMSERTVAMAACSAGWDGATASPQLTDVGSSLSRDLVAHAAAETACGSRLDAQYGRRGTGSCAFTMVERRRSAISGSYVDDHAMLIVRLHALDAR